MSRSGINLDPRARISEAFSAFLSGRNTVDNAEQAAAAAIIDEFDNGFVSGEDGAETMRTFDFSALIACGALFLNRPIDGAQAVTAETRSHIKTAVVRSMAPAARPSGKLVDMNVSTLNEIGKARDAKTFLARAFDLASMLAYMEIHGFQSVFDTDQGVFKVPTLAWEANGAKCALRVKPDATKLLNNRSAWLMIQTDADGEEKKKFDARSSVRSLMLQWKKPNKSGNSQSNGTSLKAGLEAVLATLTLDVPLSEELNATIEAVKARILQWEQKNKGELRQAS